ncbi:MAG: aspartate kinase [Myxococcales bacterium]|nr:aspartate kinase [Myxococcales bacterium]
MIVMKFGGSSVADRPQIAKVTEIVRARVDRRPVVISSAHKGITDGLVAAAKAAQRGDRGPYPVIERQRAIAAELGCPAALLEPFFAEIRDLLRGIRLVKELSPRSLDYISSFGERMAVRVIADFMTRNGVPAAAHDVWDLGFLTDSHFGRARPLLGYEGQMRAAFAALPAAVVPVVTGFIGRDEAGEITTVGRNGSDLTATLVGAALGAEEVQIWSDTDGVMSADPRIVAGARNIPTMRFDEAAELAYFGSRVLHPSTLLPAMGRAIPVRVMNTNRPEHPGTVITGAPGASRPVTSIAYKERQTIVTLSSTRMFEQAGFLAEVFAAVGRHEIVVDMVATSEVSLSFTTHDQRGLAAALAELRALGEVAIHPGKSILVVVGQQIAASPGIGARILRAIADAGVNVEMLSHAAGSINLSMALDDADIPRAVPLLHRVLFEDAS